MRLLIHDFAGYSFPIQLSRALAARGHQVTHLYSLGLQGPKGRLDVTDEEAKRLTIRGIPLSSSFRKYSPVRRFLSQRKYARDLKAIISRECFDAILSGDTPIDVQAELLWYCHRKNIAFVHWVQDVYCHALDFFLRRKLGNLAGTLSLPFYKLEQSVAVGSDASVVIAPAFRDELLNWGVPSAKITVLENWAPIDEVDFLPHENAWSHAHGLTDKTVFLYSGTLGLKHRPDLLYRLAESLDHTCKVVVITEGAGREYLERMPKLENLLLLDFQPYDRLSQMLASGDVLVAALDPDAGQFAVPSKILSYLCAGRPILFAAPEDNLAASIVGRSAAGFIVDPDKTRDWIEVAKNLAANKSLRLSLGTNARRYAEENFNIASIASAFEEVLLRVCPHFMPPVKTSHSEIQPEYTPK